MNLKRIVKLVISMVLLLTLIFSISMPVFAFTSPEPTGNKVVDFFENLMYAICIIIVAIFVIPILGIISLIQAVFTGSLTPLEAITKFFEAFASMWGF